MSLALAKAPTRRQKRKREKKLKPPSLPEDDLVLDERSGVVVSSHGRDRGTPELNRNESAYRTQTVETRFVKDGDGLKAIKERRDVRRTNNVIGLMRRSRLLSHDEARAARRFQTNFEIARHDPRKCSKLVWTPPGKTAEATERQIQAGNDVWDALKALGGPNSINGQCAWWVLGAGMSATEWGEKKVFGGGRPIRQEHATGIIMATCGLLAKHYGYVK